MSNRLPGPDSEPAWRGGRDMHETDLATIDSQIEAARAEVSLAEFLNNFELKLPGGGHRIQFQDVDLILDMPYATSESDYKRAAMSEKTRDPEFTLRKFFEDIDEVIRTEPDFNPGHLEALRQDWQTAKKTAADDSVEKLEAYLAYSLPIYRRLRMMGYSHYDLWG